MQSFAETIVNYPDGQVNIQPPPDTSIANGFIPETAGARGQPLAAQWINWLFRTLFRYANRDRVRDSGGAQLFHIPNASIRIEAIDKDDPNKYLVAIGYKPASGVHVLKVTASSTLTLGTALVDGTQPVLGGSANVQVVGYSRQIGDL
jgi:hypothetical protein